MRSCELVQGINVAANLAIVEVHKHNCIALSWCQKLRRIAHTQFLVCIVWNTSPALGAIIMLRNPSTNAVLVESMLAPLKQDRIALIHSIKADCANLVRMNPAQTVRLCTEGAGLSVLLVCGANHFLLLVNLQRRLLVV